MESTCLDLMCHRFTKSNGSNILCHAFVDEIDRPANDPKMEAFADEVDGPVVEEVDGAFVDEVDDIANDPKMEVFVDEVG